MRRSFLNCDSEANERNICCVSFGDETNIVNVVRPRQTTTMFHEGDERPPSKNLLKSFIYSSQDKQMTHEPLYFHHRRPVLLGRYAPSLGCPETLCVVSSCVVGVSFVRCIKLLTQPPSCRAGFQESGTPSRKGHRPRRRRRPQA